MTTRSFIVPSAIVLALTTAAPLLAQSYRYDPYDYNSYRTPDTACMQEAVRDRAEAQIDVYEDYSDAIETAIRKRGQDEAYAWSLSDSYSRNAALQDAQRTFDVAFRDAGNRLFSAKQTVAREYADDERACRTTRRSSSSSSGCTCTQQYDPVCGYDGRTYGNECAARCAGVGVGYYGECTQRQCRSYGSCRYGESCPSGMYCSGYPSYGCYPTDCAVRF